VAAIIKYFEKFSPYYLKATKKAGLENPAFSNFLLPTQQFHFGKSSGGTYYKSNRFF
jgi:hypothetical protein